MRKPPTILIWAALGLGLAALLVVPFLPRAVTVDTVTLHRGTLRVTVDDDGRTRVRERYTVSAPVHGRLVRTPLDPGDRVSKAETVIAEFAPSVPVLLDQRSRQQAVSRLEQAGAAVKRAKAQQGQAAADLSFASSELLRVEKLVGEQIRTEEALERAQRDLTRAREGQSAAAFAVEIADFGEQLARANLQVFDRLPDDDRHRERGTPPTTTATFKLHSPINGQVLRVFEESSRTVVPGQAILELGDLGQLEIIADYLSQDAVKVKPGMPVYITGFGGEDAPGKPRQLRGKVRRVEPSGFTKISALGVEEQRVNILVDPDDEATAWSELGDGYRVELRIELWAADDKLLVPTGCFLDANGDQAGVLVVVDQHAHRRQIRIGQRSRLQAEVIAGLQNGDQVILYPSAKVTDGSLVVNAHQ